MFCWQNLNKKGAFDILNAIFYSMLHYVVGLQRRNTITSMLHDRWCIALTMTIILIRIKVIVRKSCGPTSYVNTSYDWICRLFVFILSKPTVSRAGPIFILD